MDDQKPTEETRDPVEDLETTAEDAEQVKGGAANTFRLTFNGQTTAPAANNDPNQRGGWDGNHNETLIRI